MGQYHPTTLGLKGAKDLNFEEILQLTHLKDLQAKY